MWKLTPGTVTIVGVTNSNDFPLLNAPNPVYSGTVSVGFFTSISVPF